MRPLGIAAPGLASVGASIPVAASAANRDSPTDAGRTPPGMDRSRPIARSRWWARAFGGVFLAGSVTHVVLVSVSSTSYDSFADSSYWPFITHAWRSVVVPNIYYLIPLLAVFEATVGILLLISSTRRIGIAAAMAFTVALMLFGWGFWLWSLPALALLEYFRRLENRRRAATRRLERSLGNRDVRSRFRPAR